MNIVKTKAVAAKKFVEDHKTKIAVVATAAPLLALVVRNQKVFNEFLKENDLFDKFYDMTDED